MNGNGSSLDRTIVLYVDEDAFSRRMFSVAYGENHSIVTVANRNQAFEAIRRLGCRIGVLIANQWMPDQSPIWMLRETQEMDPGIVRILATAYYDGHMADEARRMGVYRMVPLPWDPYEMVEVLHDALQACERR